MDVMEELGKLYRSEVANTFYADDVTEAAHACQAAQLAQDAGSADELIASTFLHDVGHLLLEDYAPAGVALSEDRRHEQIGANYLSHYLPLVVVEPVRLHVTAKRYLCAVDSSYHNTLSEASKRSLAVQGGKMNDEEVTAFERSPYCEAAVSVRKCDDLAKVSGQTTQPIDHWLKTIAKVIQI